MRFKNVFCTQLYKDTFSKVLKEDEFTHGDEILVDMEEPDGDRISYIIMHHGHSISDCWQLLRACHRAGGIYPRPQPGIRGNCFCK